MDGIELDVVHGRREPRNVPIMIGATGDLMMEMTGEIADGCCDELLRRPRIQRQGAGTARKRREESGTQAGGHRPPAVDRLLGG
ncbi:MAG: hypothetical protein MZV63_72580 [Marinilabiliales bacterium]|nr:hypothetical protein [Marinilabiliales bacterium]